MILNIKNDIFSWICNTILPKVLTHLPLVPHVCVKESVNIGSDNGLSPNRRQAIIQTNVWLLSIGLLGTNFSENLIKIQNFSFTKMHLKTSSAKWRPFFPGGDELTLLYPVKPEALALMCWIRYVILKCYIEKRINVTELYKLICCSVGRHTCKTIWFYSECL